MIFFRRSRILFIILAFPLILLLMMSTNLSVLHNVNVFCFLTIQTLLMDILYFSQLSSICSYSAALA